MYHILLEGKSEEEIFENTYLYNLYLASKESAQLSTEECIKCINKHGVLTNLIIFHLNEKCIFTNELCKVIVKDYRNVKNLTYYFSLQNIELLLNYISRNKENINIDDGIINIDDDIIDIDKGILYDDEEFYMFIEQLIYARLNYKITFDLLIKQLIDLIKFFGINNFSEEFFINAWSKWQSPVLFEKSTEHMIKFMRAICGVTYKFTADNKAILAYKGVKEDYTSSLTDRVIYTPGNIYECVCDRDLSIDNSFGLSAWNYEGAHNYCSAHVMLVRIELNNIHYVNFINGKIRCDKFMVIKEVYDKTDN